MEKELKKAAKACPCWYCEFTEAQKQSAREMAREKEQVLLRKLYPPANIRLGAHAEAVFAEHFNQKVNVDYYEFGDDYCDALLPGLELVDVKGTRFTDCQPLRVEEINTALDFVDTGWKIIFVFIRVDGGHVFPQGFAFATDPFVYCSRSGLCRPETLRSPEELESTISSLISKAKAEAEAATLARQQFTL